MSGIIGKKIGMTSIYDESGKNIPCTILQAGPCTITQIKTEDNDGYSSFQLGFDEKIKNTTKSYEGQFKKSKSKPMNKLVEFKGFEGDLKLGDKITVEAELFSLDGSKRYFEKKTGKVEDFSQIGKEVGQILKTKSNNSYKR